MPEVPDTVIDKITRAVRDKYGDVQVLQLELDPLALVVQDDDDSYYKVLVTIDDAGEVTLGKRTGVDERFGLPSPVSASTASGLRQRRDAVIAAAVASGRIGEQAAGRYRRAYDQDPAGTEALLAALTPVPLSAVAAAAGVHTGDEFAGLFSPSAVSRDDPRRREERHEREDAAAEAYTAWRQATEPYANPHSEREYRELHEASGPLTRDEWIALFGDDEGFE